MQSITLLSEATAGFAERCVEGLSANRDAIECDLDRSLVPVTAVAPHIGYDAASEIALKAHREGKTLREAGLKLDVVTTDQFDAWVRPAAMLGPTKRKI